MKNAPSVETYSTPFGTFSVDTLVDKKMAHILREGSHHQGDAVTILSAFFSKGDTVVDAGAHIGTLSIPLARSGANVISFEPIEQTYALLEENVAVNNATVDARRKGLGERASQMRLVIGGNGNAGSQSLEEGEGGIEVVRLDDEVDTAVAVKIDVEGMELSVLRGAEKLIEKSHPVIFFEMNLSQMRKFHATEHAVQSFLEARGYQLFYSIGKGDSVILGKVGSLSLLTASIVPGAVFFGRQSYPFDILAVPKGRLVPFRTISAPETHVRMALRKIGDMVTRAVKVK